MARNLWSRDELIVTLALYFKLPFGRLNQTTKEVKDLARILGRTPGSIAIRLTNFAACDPYILNSGRTGMQAGRKVCLPIWEEYASNREQLFMDAEAILAKMKKVDISKHLGITTTDLKGTDKMALVKERVNQNVFREMILNNYGHRCAITGINIDSLLVASHIKPWAADESERLNPENGICLSPLYDKAFDKGFIGITPEYEIILSRELKEYSKEPFFDVCFQSIEHTKILLPEEHHPSPDFLQYHIDNIFSLHD